MKEHELNRNQIYRVDETLGNTVNNGFSSHGDTQKGKDT